MSLNKIGIVYIIFLYMTIEKNTATRYENLLSLCSAASLEGLTGGCTIRLPMPRSIVRAFTRNLFILDFLYLPVCPLARSFALLTHDIGVSASGTRISISNATSAAQQRGGRRPERVWPRNASEVDPPRRWTSIPRGRRPSRSSQWVDFIVGEQEQTGSSPCRQVLALRTGR